MRVTIGVMVLATLIASGDAGDNQQCNGVQLHSRTRDQQQLHLRQRQSDHRLAQWLITNSVPLKVALHRERIALLFHPGERAELSPAVVFEMWYKSLCSVENAVHTLQLPRHTTSSKCSHNGIMCAKLPAPSPRSCLCFSLS